MRILVIRFRSSLNAIFSVLFAAFFNACVLGDDFSHLPEDLQNRINVLVGDSFKEETNNERTENIGPNPPESKEVVKMRNDGVTETILPDEKKVFKKGNETVILTPDNKVLYSDSPNKPPIVISNFQRPKVEQRIYIPPARKPPITAKPIAPNPLDPSKLSNSDLPVNNSTRPPENHNSGSKARTGSTDTDNSARRSQRENFSWEDLSTRSSSIRHHNTGDHLIEDGRSPFIPPANYKPPLLDIPDLVKSSSRNNNLGINSIVRESGMIDYVLPDGTNATIYPGYDTVRLKTPNANEEFLKPNQDGIVKIEGKGFGDSRIELNINPASGQTFAQNSSSSQDANGERFVVRGVLNSDGTSLTVDSKGNSWDRAQNGEIRNSEYKNGDVTFKYNSKTDFTTALDSSGKLLAIKVKNDNEFKDLDSGKPVDLSKITTQNIAEIANEKSTAYNPAKVSALPQRPQSPDVNRIPLSSIPTGTQRYEQFAKAMPANNKNRDEIFKYLQEINALANRSNQTSKNLEELKEKEKKLNESIEKEVLRQQNEKANQDLKKKKEDLEKQISEAKDAFAKAQEKAEKERFRVNSSIKDLERERANANNTMSSRTNDIENARSNAAKRMLALEKAGVEAEERRLKGLIDNSLSQIERMKEGYNLCPDGHPWDKCGHSDLKRKWVNERLLMLLGRDVLRQLEELKAAKAKLVAAEKELNGVKANETIVANPNARNTSSGGNGNIPPPKPYLVNPIYPPKPIILNSDSAIEKNRAWSQYYKDVAEIERLFQKDLEQYNQEMAKYNNEIKNFDKKMDSFTKEKNDIDKNLESRKGSVSKLSQELARTKLLISATDSSK